VGWYGGCGSQLLKYCQVVAGKEKNESKQREASALGVMQGSGRQGSGGHAAHKTASITIKCAGVRR
jgi:hypothetical protein